MPAKPQVTTLPSDFKAAKADWVENIVTTSLAREDDTVKESPPAPASPHVTTLPSDFKAAYAVGVENMVTTPLARDEETEEESPPLA